MPIWKPYLENDVLSLAHIWSNLTNKMFYANCFNDDKN
jgi:hypothetical protein